MIDRYCIIRSDRAGVFAGILKARNGTEVWMDDCRRIWYWDGAASLSELAVKGTAKPDNCKFPCAVPEILITGVIEIIPCTEQAKQSIKGVSEWKKNK